MRKEILHFIQETNYPKVSVKIKVVIMVKKNYTTMFLLLFVASISGGLALKNVYDYSMLAGVGLGLTFLLCAFIAINKKPSKY